MSSKEKPATSVVTGRVRMAFPSILSPKKNDKNEDVYQLIVLVPKTDTSGTIDRMKAAIKAAMVAKFGTDTAKWPKGLKNPVKDGDDEHFDKWKDSHAGNWVVSCSSKTAPGVVDANMQAVIDSKQVYGGRWCRAALNAFYYDNKSRGISFGLNHVQLLEDDQPFGNRTRAEDVFDKVAIEKAAVSSADSIDDLLA